MALSGKSGVSCVSRGLLLFLGITPGRVCSRRDTMVLSRLVSEKTNMFRTSLFAALFHPAPIALALLQNFRNRDDVVKESQVSLVEVHQVIPPFCGGQKCYQNAFFWIVFISVDQWTCSIADEKFDEWNGFVLIILRRTKFTSADVVPSFLEWCLPTSLQQSSAWQWHSMFGCKPWY